MKTDFVEKYKSRYLNFYLNFYRKTELFWSVLLFMSLFLTFLWNAIFLNKSAFVKWIEATINTYFLGLLSTFLAFVFGWGIVLLKQKLETIENPFPLTALRIFLDFLKSLPQVLWLLLGYVILIYNFQSADFLRYFWLGFVLAIIFLNDVYDEILARILFFRRSGFYDAMLVLGIPESRIINHDVLRLNSMPYLVNRAIVIFASSVFLLCSADFIISVGLTTELSLSSLPITLGNVLANIASKEDLLAVREVFSNPIYLKELITTHLQGISAAFTLVFTLISMYKISNGLIERKNLNK